jgi:hypothetical protein
MIAKIQVRNDTAANWTSANPTLLVGEVGYETDTKKKKMGDGVTAWNSLEYNMLQASDLNDDDTVVKTTVDGVELFVGKSVGEMRALLGYIGGTSFIFVKGEGTATENATELQTAYTLAKTMTPFGAALSATNRMTIVVSPGKYTFGVAKFAVDTQYIDIVSLTGNLDIVLDGINVTANDVFLKGIDCGTDVFTIATDLNLLKCDTCTGGESSFGCSSGGVLVSASGTFTNCTGGDLSFGGLNGTASGTFTDCTGGNHSFGGQNGTASGTFTDCTGGNYSFGGQSGTASGTFTDCIGGESSFGGYGGIASGTFTDCTSGDYSFGGGIGTASGTFTNCTGGELSFGYIGTLTGKLYWCRMTSGTFQTVSGSGQTRMCLDGTNVLNNQG